MSNVALHNELDYLYYGAALCEGKKCDRDGTWQIAPFFGSIPFNAIACEALRAFETRVAEKFPDLAEYGRKRAKKAYLSDRDSTTKPSYANRLVSFPGTNINQVAEIVRLGVREPSSGGLVFSVFHPKDMIDRRRPGYVPCLVSGSVLLSDGELQISAFFRSQSVMEFGLHDLLFLRQLQQSTLVQLQAQSAKFKQVKPGLLNIFAARVFVKRRLCRVGNRTYRYRNDTYNAWLAEVAEIKRQYLLS